MSVQTFSEAEYVTEAQRLTEVVAKHMGVDHVRIAVHPSNRVRDQRACVSVVQRLTSR